MPLFGNNGQGANNQNRMNWWDDGDMQIKNNNAIFDEGSVTAKTNRTMWAKKGVVSSSNSTIWTPSGNYHLSGNILHGPNGESWTGVKSKEDAMSIIARKLKH